MPPVNRPRAYSSARLAASSIGRGKRFASARPIWRTERKGFDEMRCDRYALMAPTGGAIDMRSEEHTSELQSLMRISYGVSCLKNKQTTNTLINTPMTQSTHK